MQRPTGEETQVAYDTNAFERKFGIGKTKLHEELNSGRLVARRFGRKLIIRHEDAIAWLDSLPVRVAKHREAA